MRSNALWNSKAHFAPMPKGLGGEMITVIIDGQVLTLPDARYVAFTLNHETGQWQAHEANPLQSTSIPDTIQPS
jgi:hypothetical protein